MESDLAEPARHLPPGREARWARERVRVLAALAFSIAIHALIISMELGIPGFALPWTGQRAPEMQLTVTLTARPVEAPPPVPVAETELPIARGALRPRASSRADPPAFEVVVPVEVPVAPRRKPPARPRRQTSISRAAADAPSLGPDVPPPQPIVITQEETRQETFRMAPPEPESPRAPDAGADVSQAEESAETGRRAEEEKRKEEEAKRLVAESEALRRAEEAARRESEERERQRVLALQREQEVEARRKAEEEARRLAEAERRKEEEARRLALEDAKRKEEVARQLALEEAKRRAEAERRKEEEAKRAALEVEALRRAEEVARQQAAARQKELEARRQAEVERRKEQEAAARAAAGPSSPADASPVPGALSGREIAARAIEQLRTPGVIPLDPPRPPPPPPTDGARRFPALGAERDVVLRYYIESWRAKIERNGPLNYRPLAGRRAPEYPVVTVAVRSDGSLEHVHIHKSSGLREIDEAVRRIAEFNAPYSRFPPAIASQYDVIEIRRVWQFDDILRIVEETR